MKKKLLSVGLALTLALGILPLAACDTLTSQLLDNFIAAESGEAVELRLSMGASASYMGQKQVSSQEITVVASEKTPSNSDLYQRTYNGQEYRYGVTFVRGEKTYTASRTSGLPNQNQFDHLLNDLASGAVTLDVSESEPSDDTLGDLNLPSVAANSDVTGKLLRNFILIGGAEAEETTDGYQIDYELDDAMEAVLDELEPIAKAIDKKPTMTVSECLNGKGKSLFNRLLKDISAEEGMALLEGEASFSEQLPEVKQNESFADYLRRALQTEINGEVAGDEQVVNALREMGITPTTNQSYQKMVEEAREDISDKIAMALFASMGMGMSKIDDSEIEMVLSFDKDQHFTQLQVIVQGEGFASGGVGLSVTIDLNVVANSKRTLTDVTKFYILGAPHWSDQTVVVDFDAEYEYFDKDNYHCIDRCSVTLSCTVSGNNLKVAVSSKKIEKLNFECSLDLRQTVSSYTDGDCMVKVIQSDPNERGGYETMCVTLRYLMYDETVTRPEPFRIYAHQQVTDFKKEYEKVPVTLS